MTNTSANDMTAEAFQAMTVAEHAAWAYSQRLEASAAKKAAARKTPAKASQKPAAEHVSVPVRPGFRTGPGGTLISEPVHRSNRWDV